MAETELSVLSAQCLDRRIPDRQTLIEEVAAWEGDRNKNHAKADWQFHHGRCSHQAETAIPSTMSDSGH